jgi:hypothetical protein
MLGFWGLTIMYPSRRWDRVLVEALSESFRLNFVRPS